MPLCIGNATDAVLTLENTGSLAGGTNPTAIITIPAGNLFFNPVGTFTDATCTVPAFGPTGAPATIEVRSGSTTLCTGAAQYGREGEVGLVTGTCTGGGVTYTLVFDGAQQPCFPGAPFDPCALAPEWVGTYEQI